MEPPAFPGGGALTVRAAPGTDALLEVPAPSGTAPFHYTWSRAGASLEGRFTSTEERGVVRLTVSAARTDDTALYTLQASNAAGSDTARVRLEVSADEAPTGDDPPTFLRRLQDLTVKVGTRTRFLVEILSNTECKVTWYRNERRLLEAERVSLARDGNFWCADVAAVSVDDAGRWTCTAENAAGRATCSAHLNVLVPKAYKRPEFVEELRALLTELGTVSLECKVVGVPTPVLRWFKDSREIKAGDVFALTANADDPTSLGTYTCEAVNCMGRAYSSSKVHVVGRASREGSTRPISSGMSPEPPPIFTRELEDQFTRICEPLTLACQVVVPPWPRSVVWYNKEGKVEPSDRYHVLEDGVGGYMLEIPSAEWADEGEWKCVATSSGGRVGISTCHVTMDVPKNYRKPRFMENLQAVLTEEGLVSFECKVVGFPTPVLSWFKDGQELKPGDVYQLTGTNSLGSYCCIARNCMGQASSSAELTVEDIQNQLNEEEKLQLFSKNQAPKFVQGLKSVESKIDEPFRFTVKVAIPPEPSVLWYRDDQPVDESNRCHLGKEERGVFFLDIQNLELLDQAEWKCVAMNDFGHSVTSCFLKLIIPRHYKKPRFLENLQAILSDEGAVNLECKVIGVPQPILKWYKDGEELKPGDIHRIISGQDGTCCLGTYTCEASNCMGVAASSASLLGFEDSIKAKEKKKAEEQALQRNLSLSTIHEERTSQMYDTPVGDITLDDKGEISFSFDGKEVSVSLYETPDLTEEEAKQIVEMYADQLSENVTEHNVVELPPLRFVKETSTSGNLLMEAIIIDVSPEYFTSPEEDLRTEADVEDISIADENGPPQLSLDQDVDIAGEDYLEKTMALLSDEKADAPLKSLRKKSDSQRSAEDFFSLSRDQSLSEEKKDDDTQALSESELHSFASAHSSGKPKSKSSKPSAEDGQESSEPTKTILFKDEARKSVEPEPIPPVVRPKRERRTSRSSRRSSSGSEKSLSRSREEAVIVKTEVTETKADVEIPKKPSLTDEEFKNQMSNVSTSLTKVINDVQLIERDIILKSELMSSAATASRSLEIISSLITPLSEIHSVADAAKECAMESKEVSSTLFNSLPQSLKSLHQSLTIIEKCIDVESDNRTLVKKTCVSFIENCGTEVQNIISDIKAVIKTDYLVTDEAVLSEIDTLANEMSTVIKFSADTIKARNLLNEANEIKVEEPSLETKHLRDTQKAVFELRSPLNSLLRIVEFADSDKIVEVSKIKSSDVILNDMSASIQDLQTSLEQIESLSVTESTSPSLQKYNTEIIETVVESILKLRSSFEQLSTATLIDNKVELKETLKSIKENLNEISTQIGATEKNIGTFDILHSDNKLDVLQKMAQILIALENNLPRLETMPDVKTHMESFHKNLTKILENVIESNEAKKYLDLIEICDAVNRINTSIKAIDTENVLPLASLSNTLTIIKDNFINNVFDSELNCSVLSNIADVLVGIQEAINRAEEVGFQVDSEHVQDLSAQVFDAARANVVIEHIDQTIAAINTVRTVETTAESKTNVAPVLENICPVLEDLRRYIASVSTGIIEHDEHISDISEASFAETLATPLCELNQNLVILNQNLVENIESLKDNSIIISAVAEPLHELQKTLEVIQQEVISQYGEDLTPYEISVNMASAVQNLQSCILMIQEQPGVEAADDMSTLEDISGIKTTAETIPSDRLVLPTAEETNIEQTLEPFSEEIPRSAVAEALHTLNEHVAVLQNPEVMDALDTLSEISDYSSLKSVALGLSELHTGIQEILHPVIMEGVSDVPNLVNPTKLATIAEPLHELHQSLSVLEMNNIPIYENILDLPAEKLHSVFEKISDFKEHLDKCLQAIMPAIELADQSIEISNKVGNLRQVCEHLKDIIAVTKDHSLDLPTSKEVKALEEVVDNLLEATDVSKGVKIEQVKVITAELLEKVLDAQEELIQFTPQSPEILAKEARLIEGIDEVESNIAVLQQYDFIDMSRASDLTSCISPQLAMEIETESLIQIEDIADTAVNVVQDSGNKMPIADMIIVEDFFKICKNEFTILRCLISKASSHRKIVRLLQEFYAIQMTIEEFKNKKRELSLSDDVSACLATFLFHAEECLKSVQESLIKIVTSQSQFLFNEPVAEINSSVEKLKSLIEGQKEKEFLGVVVKISEIVEITKPWMENIQGNVIKELQNPLLIQKDQQDVLTRTMEDFSEFIEEQITLSSNPTTIETLEAVLKCIHKHQDYRDATTTGKTLIVLKCLLNCSGILHEQIIGHKEIGIAVQRIDEVSLKEVLTEMLEPLQILHSQLVDIQDQILSGVQEDSISIDIDSTESLVKTMTEVHKDIVQKIESDNISVANEELSLIMEVDSEINLINDTLKVVEEVTATQAVVEIVKPIVDIEKSLKEIISEKLKAESKEQLPKEKAAELVQHIDQYIELIEIVEEISAVIRIEDLKETVDIAKKLRQSISGSEILQTQETEQLMQEISVEQARLALKLQNALTSLHVQVLDSAQELAPERSEEVLQRIAKVTAQLNADLVAVTGMHVAVQAPIDASLETLKAVEVVDKEIESISAAISTQEVPLDTAKKSEVALLETQSIELQSKDETLESQIVSEKVKDSVAKISIVEESTYVESVSTDTIDQVIDQKPEREPAEEVTVLASEETATESGELIISENLVSLPVDVKDEIADVVTEEHRETVDVTVTVTIEETQDVKDSTTMEDLASEAAQSMQLDTAIPEETTLIIESMVSELSIGPEPIVADGTSPKESVESQQQQITLEVAAKADVKEELESVGEDVSKQKIESESLTAKASEELTAIEISEIAAIEEAKDIETKEDTVENVTTNVPEQVSAETSEVALAESVTDVPTEDTLTKPEDKLASVAEAIVKIQDVDIQDATEKPTEKAKDETLTEGTGIVAEVIPDLEIVSDSAELNIEETPTVLVTETVALEGIEKSEEEVQVKVDVSVPVTEEASQVVEESAALEDFEVPTEVPSDSAKISAVESAVLETKQETVVEETGVCTTEQVLPEDAAVGVAEVLNVAIASEAASLIAEITSEAEKTIADVQETMAQDVVEEKVDALIIDHPVPVSEDVTSPIDKLFQHIDEYVSEDLVESVQDIPDLTFIEELKTSIASAKELKESIETVHPDVREATFDKPEITEEQTKIALELQSALSVIHQQALEGLNKCFESSKETLEKIVEVTENLKADLVAVVNTKEVFEQVQEQVGDVVVESEVAVSEPQVVDEANVVTSQETSIVSGAQSTAESPVCAIESKDEHKAEDSKEEIKEPLVVEQEQKGDKIEESSVLDSEIVKEEKTDSTLVVPDVIQPVTSTEIQPLESDKALEEKKEEILQTAAVSSETEPVKFEHVAVEQSETLPLEQAKESSEEALIRAGVETLLQHMKQYTSEDTVQKIDKVSSKLNCDEIKQSIGIARDLVECINTLGTLPADDSKDSNDFAKLSQQLFDALTTIQVSILDQTEELAPVLGKDPLEHLADLVVHLVDDLSAVITQPVAQVLAPSTDATRDDILGIPTTTESDIPQQENIKRDEKDADISEKQPEHDAEIISGNEKTDILTQIQVIDEATSQTIVKETETKQSPVENVLESPKLIDETTDKISEESPVLDTLSTQASVAEEETTSTTDVIKEKSPSELDSNQSQSNKIENVETVNVEIDIKEFLEAPKDETIVKDTISAVNIGDNKDVMEKIPAEVSAQHIDITDGKDTPETDSIKITKPITELTGEHNIIATEEEVKAIEDNATEFPESLVKVPIPSDVQHPVAEEQTEILGEKDSSVEQAIVTVTITEQNIANETPVISKQTINEDVVKEAPNLIHDVDSSPNEVNESKDTVLTEAFATPLTEETQKLKNDIQTEVCAENVPTTMENHAALLQDAVVTDSMKDLEAVGEETESKKATGMESIVQNIEAYVTGDLPKIVKCLAYITDCDEIKESVEMAIKLKNIIEAAQEDSRVSEEISKFSPFLENLVEALTRVEIQLVICGQDLRTRFSEQKLEDALSATENLNICVASLLPNKEDIYETDRVETDTKPCIRSESGNEVEEAVKSTLDNAENKRTSVKLDFNENLQTTKGEASTATSNLESDVLQFEEHQPLEVLKETITPTPGTDLQEAKTLAESTLQSIETDQSIETLHDNTIVSETLIENEPKENNECDQIPSERVADIQLIDKENVNDSKKDIQEGNKTQTPVTENGAVGDILQINEQSEVSAVEPKDSPIAEEDANKRGELESGSVMSSQPSIDDRPSENVPQEIIQNLVQIQNEQSLIQRIDELICNEVTEAIETISTVTSKEDLKESVMAAKELRECIAAITTTAAEEAVTAMVPNKEKAQLVQKLADSLVVLNTQILDNAQELIPVVETETLEKVANVITHLKEDLQTAAAIYEPGVQIADIEKSIDVPEENPMKQLEVLLQEVNDKIDLAATNRDAEDTEALRDTLDEVQTVIIKLKRDYDESVNDTLNETLEDLECSVRSVQLQINEESPPELLKEACATLQLLLNNMSETQSIEITEVVTKDKKSQALLEKCSDETQETVKLLDEACKIETPIDSNLTNIIGDLNKLKNTIKGLRLNFLSDAQTLIDRGIDVTQSLDQIEDKVYSLEKDVDNEKQITPEVRDCIITAIHSIYGSISNMRSTISSIQKRYMFENYGKPSETVLKTIKNVTEISKLDTESNKQNWKKFSKSLRKVLNHFEDVKFYINLDKTARLPSDAAFTKIILNDLKSCINEVLISHDIVIQNKEEHKKVQDTIKCVEKHLHSIESKATLDVKEKIPIFKDVASHIHVVSEFIKKKIQETFTEVDAEVHEERADFEVEPKSSIQAVTETAELQEEAITSKIESSVEISQDTKSVQMMSEEVETEFVKAIVTENVDTKEFEEAISIEQQGEKPEAVTQVIDTSILHEAGVSQVVTDEDTVVDKTDKSSMLQQDQQKETKVVEDNNKSGEELKQEDDTSVTERSENQPIKETDQADTETHELKTTEMPDIHVEEKNQYQEQERQDELLTDKRLDGTKDIEAEVKGQIKTEAKDTIKHETEVQAVDISQSEKTEEIQQTKEQDKYKDQDVSQEEQASGESKIEDRKPSIESTDKAEKSKVQKKKSPKKKSKLKEKTPSDEKKESKKGDQKKDKKLDDEKPGTSYEHDRSADLEIAAESKKISLEENLPESKGEDEIHAPIAQCSKDKDTKVTQEILEKENLEKEKLEKERLEKEKLEAQKLKQEQQEKESRHIENHERLEQEKQEKERLEQEKLKQEKLMKEKLEREREEKETLEKEKLEQEMLEKDKLEQEKFGKEKLAREQEKERLENEKLEKEKIEQEKLEKEKLERERQEKEKLEKEKLEQEKLEKVKLAKEQQEKEIMEKEKLEKEKLEQEKLEGEKLEQEKLEKEKLAKEQQEKETMEKEKLEKEKLEQEKLEEEKLEQEKLKKEKLAREQQEKERLENEKLEKEKLEQEKLEKEKLEQEKLEKEKLAKEQQEKERLEKEKQEKEKLEQEKLEKEILAKERQEKEKQEKEKLELEKLKKEKLAKGQQEKVRLEKEKQEKEKLEQEKLEKEKLERERHEKEKLAKEQQEKERLEKEKQEKEKHEQEKLEKEKLERERQEEEKLAKEQQEKERLEKEKLEKENLEQEKLEKKKLKKEKQEKEKLEKEKLEQEKLEKEKLEKEKLEKEKLQQEKLAKERQEEERLEKEKLKKEKLEQEKLEKEKLAKEQQEKERLEKEKLEKERLEKEKLEKEKLEQEKLRKEQLEKEEKERLEKEKLEKEKLEKARLRKEKKESIKKAKEEKEQLEKQKERKQSFEKQGQEIGHEASQRIESLDKQQKGQDAVYLTKAEVAKENDELDKKKLGKKKIKDSDKTTSQPHKDTFEEANSVETPRKAENGEVAAATEWHDDSYKQKSSPRRAASEKPSFVDHNHRDYTTDFARPSGYRERTFDDRLESSDYTALGKSATIYKAETIYLDSQLRAPAPYIDSRSSEPSERRELRQRSKALSEARSLASDRRTGSRDVKRKPVFSTYLTDRTAVEGSRVKLTCSALSSSEPTITWYKNGVLLDNKMKYRTKFVDGLITLEVLNAIPSDSAEYSCTVQNENGSISTSANLKVYPSFEASPIPPTFTRSIRDTYHLADDELILECRIRGQPLPTITWLKDDRPVSSDRYQAFYLADGVCRLAIIHPTPQDSGKYTCKADNSMWSDQITHIVNFTGRESRLSPNLATVERSRFTRHAMESRRPHFGNVLTDYQVVKGGTIGLQVEIRGCPTRVEWLREGRSVTDVYRNARTFVEQGLYTLALSDVTEKESGMYTCRAWSTHGNVDMNAAITVVQPNELDGKPAIIIGRPEKDILISVGEDINISFRVQGEPKPKVIFMKGIRDITTSQRVCKMTSDDYVKFTVKRSVVSDAGTYCILARNAYGCDRAFVTVVVRQRASSENLISDWTYPLDDTALSITDRKYKSVPDRIPGEPSVVDGGNNWLSLAWPKPDPGAVAPVLAYKVESWLIGKEGGARWVELGITPLNSFDAFNLKQGEEYHFRVTPRNRYGWGEPVQTSTPIGVGLAGARPEFVDILPGQLKVLAGETANLYCSVKGKPTPEVVWMKNGHEIEEEEARMATTFNGCDCSLTIKDISTEDDGRYSCEASNMHGRASTYARLAVVTDRLIWEADVKLKRERSQGVEGEYPPQFTMRLRDRRVQATYPVRLTCQVVGNPPPTVTWYKDGQEVPTDNRHNKYQDEHFHTLEIAPTNLEDGGVYEALARNPFGAVSCRCGLVVDKGIRAYVAPEFCCGLEPLYKLNEGDELRISAVVEAYPSVGVTWYRDGVRLRPSRRAIMTLDRDGQIELALAAVTPRDAGVYMCTASNEVGRASTSGKVEVTAGRTVAEKKTPAVVISSDVPYSKEPMFIRKPRSSEAREGDTVIIQCEVVGDPKPDVYWLRDFLKPDYYRDATHFKRVGDGPEYRFEIPHAKLDYTGAYSVVARNVHGEAKAIISLQILAKDPSASDDAHNVRYGRVEVIPRFERNLTDLLSYDGDAVEFECRVSGNPEPYIRWFHYNEIIRDCPDFEALYEDGAARLKIKQVTAEDEGTYTCEAANCLGKATSSACLVVYPPGEPNTLSQRLRRPPALLSGASTPRSTPRSTPARSVSRTPGPEPRRLCSPARQMAPAFYTYPFNKVVEEGDSVVFQCAVKGLPAPWATWDKDGIILTPTARITIKEKDEILRILEIDEVTIEDVGIYKITVENEFGRAEASARLEVITRKGKFYAGVRAYSASPRRSLGYRRRASTPRQD